MPVIPAGGGPQPQARTPSHLPPRDARREGDAAGQFRTVLESKKAAHGPKREAGTKPPREEAQSDVLAAPPPAPVAVSGQKAPSPDDRRSGKQGDDPVRIAGDPPAPAASSGATKPPAGQAVPLSQPGDFSSLATRLDAGMKASAQSQLTMPGEAWRAGHVEVIQQAQGLSVAVDLGRARDGENQRETLAELQARLRARGFRAIVSASRSPDGDDG